MSLELQNFQSSENMIMLIKITVLVQNLKIKFKNTGLQAVLNALKTLINSNNLKNMAKN